MGLMPGMTQTLGDDPQAPAHERALAAAETGTSPLDAGSLDPAVATLLKRSADGLVPAIAQDATSGRVLMLAWMDDEALRRTLASGQATYWSRSRREYWVKGATSGNTQAVREVRLDCDGDALLLRVDQVGPACHRGTESCFDAHLLSGVGE